MRYPILPRISRAVRQSDEARFQRREIWHIRHHSLYAPRDFDISPYFQIVKPTLEQGSITAACAGRRKPHLRNRTPKKLILQRDRPKWPPTAMLFEPCISAMQTLADVIRHRIVIVRANTRRQKEDEPVFDSVDQVAFTNDQGARAQKLFAAVVLAALDDAIADDKKYGNGPEVIARWARSRDGREVLMCAGIDPNERTVKGMMDFVRKGVRTSVALSREESERQHQRSEAEAA